MLSQRYYDIKMNTTYDLESLRADHMMLVKSNPSENLQSFEEWIEDLVENEVLIPLE